LIVKIINSIFVWDRSLNNALNNFYGTRITRATIFMETKIIERLYSVWNSTMKPLL